MPRNCSPAERAIIAAPAVNHLLYLWVADADGTMQDCSSLGALDLDLLDGAGWGETLDTPVSTGSLVIRRDTTDDSAAPTMGSSSINRTALGAYAPLFEKGRAILIKTATVLQGIIPGPSDKKPMFVGRIDGVHWQDNPMTIDISDIGAWVVDANIPEQKAYASTSDTPGDGKLLGAMIQDMLNDSIPNGSIPLYEPVTAAFEPFSKSPEDPGPLFTAIRRWAQEIGWDLRYRFDSTDAFRLTLFEPARAKTAADWIIGPSEYTNVTNLTTSIADIRNQIRVLYNDADGKLQSVIVQDDASIAKYGGPNHTPRLWQFPSGSIRTEENALQLANAVLLDLSEANADQEIVMPYFWPVQIGDMITFQANGDHYDTDQTLAVVSFQHSLVGGAGVTTIQARGKVAGAFRAWVRWVNLPGTGLPEDTRSLALKNFRELRRTPETITYGWDPVGSDVDEIWGWQKLSPQSIEPPLPPEDDEDRLWCNIKTDIPNIKLDKTTVTFDVKVPNFGFIQTWELQPVDKNLKTGYSQRMKVLSVPDVPRITEILTEEGATGLFTRITELNVVDPQALGGTLKAWLNRNVVDDADPTLTPDGTFTVAITPYKFSDTDSFALPGGGTEQIFGNVRIHPGSGKRVAFEFINSHGTSSGVIGFVLLSNGGIITPDGQLKDQSINRAEQVAAAMTLPSVYDDLPTSGRTNELAVWRNSMPIPNKLMRWTGTAWVAVATAPDLTGLLTGEQLQDHLIGLMKIASNLAPPEILTLPLPVSPGAGRTALGSDGVLYRSKPDGSGWTSAVTTIDLTGQINTSQIADAAISAAKIGAAAVQTTNIASAAITSALLAANAVQTANIAGAAITTALIAGGAISTALIAAGAVQSTQIANGAISTPKLVAGVVTANELAAGSVIAGKVAAGAISTLQLTANAVTANELAAGSVIAGKIGALAITAAELAAGAITAGKIAAGAVQAGTIAAGAVTAGTIAALAVTAGTIAALAITASELAANAVSAGKIAANAVTAGTVVAGAIGATELAAFAIIAGKIASGAVTTATMTAGTISGDRIATNTLNANSIIANSITASQIGANAITAGAILAGAVTATAIYAGAVDATKLSTIVLSETAPNAGIIQIGKLRSVDGLRYLDLAATGSNPFLQHPQVTIRADGTATFSGALSAASGSFTGALSGASITGATGTFSGTLASATFTSTAITLNGTDARLNWSAATSSGGGLTWGGAGGAVIYGMLVSGVYDIFLQAQGVLRLNGGSGGITWNGLATSYGAANSGGSGLRALCVPN